jgi:cysteine desulfurase
LARPHVGATEHPCVLAGGRFPAEAVTTLPVDENGVVILGDHADAPGSNADEASLVALMLANNETGVIHPVAEAAEVVHRAGGYLFCDAVQALGRIPVDINALGADFMILSSHKIGGPQGAGALVLRDSNVRPEPLLKGGGQERRHRAGTENVAAIAGFGVAASLARHHLEEASELALLRDRMETAMTEITPAVRFFGRDAERLPNTSLFSLPGLRAEIGVIAFDLEGVAVSAGSACSSGKTEASHVLAAMGASREETEGGIRVSLPFGTSEADIDRFIETWRTVSARASAKRAA